MDTNIKYLLDNNINIWNKDAYNWFGKGKSPDTYYRFNTFIEQVIKGNKYTTGDLGRVYGAQWRKWKGQVNPSFRDKKGFNSINTVFDKLNIKYIDQIANLIKGLKENPMGTRHIVTAWNPAELDEMALPPCHKGFQLMVYELSQQERLNLYVGTWRKSNSDEATKRFLKGKNIPKYGFDLVWEQRSVDTFLG